MGGDLVGSSPVNGGSLETWLTLIVNLVWPRVMCEKPPLRYYLDHVGLCALLGGIVLITNQYRKSWPAVSSIFPRELVPSCIRKLNMSQ